MNEENPTLSTKIDITSVPAWQGTYMPNSTVLNPTTCGGSYSANDDGWGVIPLMLPSPQQSTTNITYHTYLTDDDIERIAEAVEKRMIQNLRMQYGNISQDTPL